GNGAFELRAKQVVDGVSNRILYPSLAQLAAVAFDPAVLSTSRHSAVALCQLGEVRRMQEQRCIPLRVLGKQLGQCPRQLQVGAEFSAFSALHADDRVAKRMPDLDAT